jgi:hypothetical protein
VGFLGPRANAELIHKSHIALHASYAALPMVTSKFRPGVALPMLNKKCHSTAALPMLKLKLIPIISSKALAQILSFAYNKIDVLNCIFSFPKA